MMAGRKFTALLLCIFPGCASSPPDSGSDAPTPMLAREIRELDSRDARHRRGAERKILTLGRKACRDLSREVAERIEAADTGPGFVCLLRLLGALGGSEACRPLGRTALKRALDASVRVEAVHALRGLRSPESVPPLLECASCTEPLVLRLAALTALSTHAERDEVRDGLQRHLVFGAPPIRETAARSLLACEAPEIRELFKARLMDAHTPVRLAAVSYFIQHPDPAVSPLLHVLASSDLDLKVVLAAGRALEVLESEGE